MNVFLSLAALCSFLLSSSTVWLQLLLATLNTSPPDTAASLGLVACQQVAPQVKCAQTEAGRMSNPNPNANAPTSSSNNWRSPSAAHLQKYNLRALPEDFEPTDEEQQLLDMYEVIRNHERVAARMKEETARAKLAASDKEFQQKLAPKPNKRKRKSNAKAKAKLSEDANEDDDDDDDEDDSEDMDDGDDDDDDDAEETLHDRREAKLAELRVEVEAAKHAIAPVDQLDADALREQHLADTTLVDDVPRLMRKTKDVEAAASSLIASLTSAVTPPHDFSEKLELSNRGKVLFPVAGTEEFRWTPPEGVFAPNDGAFTVDLNDFDVARAQTGAGNNTVAIKVRAFLISSFLVWY